MADSLDVGITASNSGEVAYQFSFITSTVWMNLRTMESMVDTILSVSLKVSA